jgi:predicted nucleic acid-binding protein
MGVAVFDANVFVQLYGTGPRQGEVLSALDHYDAIAPDHVYTEFANAMGRLVRLGKLQEADAEAAVSDLPNVVRRAPSPMLVPAAYEAARRIGHGVYDCLYYVLAEAMGCPFVSEDHKFLNKARAHASVPLLELADMPEVLP